MCKIALFLKKKPIFAPQNLKRYEKDISTIET